ncbi:ankyrin repeat containing protein [Pseudozyma hubeiensis SY62]|uniref:Ankyrin repeat containing protein n=1 Tax=Pseudozyma hubeiensis (strain SY62) TaxID=1305764 RepID=R9NY42_PSEHS|nr:ankyrin repeat containing protein [Pseudozyma hubeiensis SY62]GAC93589.1 ankyrin repeat containing protein [Pseudozyma hubeiensis SY62]
MHRSCELCSANRSTRIWLQQIAAGLVQEKQFLSELPTPLFSTTTSHRRDRLVPPDRITWTIPSPTYRHVNIEAKRQTLRINRRFRKHSHSKSLPTRLVTAHCIDCWHVRDLQRFRAVLKGSPSDKSGATQSNNNGSYGAGAGSFSKSPHSHKESSGPCPPAEVNRRDHLGRTVLHHIASSTEPWSYSYLNAILSHPSVNVNLQDGESGYTPLHRALYLANLQTAIILLRRSDIDLRVKDFEGLTAFDLYNSTVAGTNPPADALSSSHSHRQHHSRILTQLFTWGSNRNYNLGLGDGDDRQLPDKITLRPPAPTNSNGTQSIEDAFRSSLPAGKKFDRIGIREVAMSRLHTVVLTDQKAANVWVCGLGSNGRLGRSPQTQTSFEPLKDFNETARSVAVAQDHTLIITASGAVYSFGLNRFSQLGYTIEQGFGTVASTSGKLGAGAGVTFGQPAAPQNIELDIQVSPRRIVGPLKKEVVLGAACSKLHSAVYTSDGLYTWGTNTGQLGYDRSGTAVQVQPRKVTALAAGAGIQEIAASDFGTACLMEGGDVFVWHNDTHFRINFPLARFSSSISVFRPRQVQPKTLISKLTSSGNTFAALSDMGDLFTFNLEHPSEYGSTGGSGRAGAPVSSAAKSSAAQSAPKPQLLWSVRKKFTAVRDVAIGADGSVILCTESGHCFVRPRRSDASGGGKGGGGKNFKFQQIPYLQRVVKVATSESGALAAIKADPGLPDVRVKGRSVEEAVRDLLPHLKVQTLGQENEKEKGITTKVIEIADVQGDADSDSDSEDDRRLEAGKTDTGRYARMALLIVEAAKRWVAGRMVSGAEDESSPDLTASQPLSTTARRQAFYGPHNLTPPFGCDAFLIADGHYLPVHKVILKARVPSLQTALQDPSVKERLPAGIKLATSGNTKHVLILTLSNCSLVSALFLLHYIYSDDLPPIWVPSVGLVIDKELKAAKVDRARIQDELRLLAERLDLPALAASIKASMPRPPEPTLRANMSALFTSFVDVDVEAMQQGKSFNDVLLRLEDRTVPVHSVILRRSPFFSALFQPHWTASRWDKDNVITLDMSHLRWEVARIVLMHLYTDNGETLFTGCDADRSLEMYMDFLVEVMAAANELLLDKLKLVVSSLLRRRILAHTVGAVMTEADLYKADQLKDITMDYCTKSMEALLEGGRLNELDQGMIRALTVYVRRKQDEKVHRTFAEDRLAALVEKHRDFYDDLDIPPPSLHLIVNKVRPKKGAGLADMKSPPFLAQDSNRRSSSARFGAKTPASPDTLRPVGAGIAQRSMDETSEVFSMDEDDLATPRKDASSSRTHGSPWAILPQVAHLSLDDTVEKSSPSRPWKSRTVEAERKQGVNESSASPALRPADPPKDLRSIMALEQQRQQTTVVSHLSNATTPSGSGTSTPVPKSVAPGFELSSISVASTRLSQKERKRQQQEAGLAAAATASAQPAPTRSGSVSSPWKMAESGSSPPDKPAASSPWSMKAAATTAMALGTSHEGTPPLSSTPGSRRPSAAPLQPGSFAGQGSRPSLSDASASPANGLGPTYTPSRMGAKSTPKRMNTSEAVWATPAVAPSLGAYGTSPSPTPALNASRVGRPEVQRGPSSNLSRSLLNADAQKVATEQVGPPASPANLTFAQIQEQQKMAIEAEQETMRQAAAARRSFLDIQEEERQAEERRREEQKQAEEFEKWFAEESKRLQKEKKGNNAGGKGKGAKKLGKQSQQQQQQSLGSNQKASKTGRDPAQATSVNGNSTKARSDKTSEAGKQSGASKPNGRQASDASANADRTPSKNAAKQDAADGNDIGKKASPKGNTKGQSSNGADGKKKPAAPPIASPMQHGLPSKPSANTTPNANLSAAAPTFTPRQG